MVSRTRELPSPAPCGEQRLGWKLNVWSAMLRLAGPLLRTDQALGRERTQVAPVAAPLCLPASSGTWKEVDQAHVHCKAAEDCPFR